jgi:hypothetical protein
MIEGNSFGGNRMTQPSLAYWAIRIRRDWDYPMLCIIGGEIFVGFASDDSSTLITTSYAELILSLTSTKYRVQERHLAPRLSCYLLGASLDARVHLCQNERPRSLPHERQRAITPPACAGMVHLKIRIIHEDM